jgi:GMP synthase (glutamine-hydrolysing)
MLAGTMRLLVIQHPDGGTAGVFAVEAEARGVALETWTPGEGEPEPAVAGYDGVVVLGGGQNVEEADRHPFLTHEIAVLQDVLARAQPVLGVCLGHQLLAAASGATVRRAPRLEFGLHAVARTPAGAADPLVSVLPDAFTAYGWHSYEVDPAGLTPLAESGVSPQALRFGPAAWGVQFHPEVDRAIIAEWYAGWEADDALPRDFDPDAELAAVDGPELDAWNALGRALFGRFAELAAARAAG